MIKLHCFSKKLFQVFFLAVQQNLSAPVADAYPKLLYVMVMMTVVMEVMRKVVLHFPVAHMNFAAIVQNVSHWVGYVMAMLIVLISLTNPWVGVNTSILLWLALWVKLNVVQVNASILIGSVMEIPTARMEVMKLIAVSNYLFFWYLRTVRFRRNY